MEKQVEEGGIVVVVGNWGMENFEGGKFRSGKRRWKGGIRFGGWHGLDPRGHVFTGQRRVKASIRTSMVHRERAWYSWQAPFYRVEAPFRWVGSEGWLLVELNVAHEGGGRSVRDLGAQTSRGLPPRRGTKEVRRRVKERRYSGG